MVGLRECFPWKIYLSMTNSVTYSFVLTLNKEIDNLSEVLVESTALLPDLLSESRAPSKCSK